MDIYLCCVQTYNVNLKELKQSKKKKCNFKQKLRNFIKEMKNSRTIYHVTRDLLDIKPYHEHQSQLIPLFTVGTTCWANLKFNSMTSPWKGYGNKLTKLTLM